MATSRSTAQRRRSQAMRRQTTYVRSDLDDAVGSADDGDAEGGEEAWAPAPRWPSTVGLILCVAGLAVAAYLTYAHYTSASNLACSESGIINCAAVTTSRYSHIFGFPVSVLGLVFFAFMIPLQLPAAWRSPSRLIRLGRLGASIVGVGMILWLVYVELLKLDAICIYCTAVHVLTFLLFVTIALGTIATSTERA